MVSAILRACAPLLALAAVSAVATPASAQFCESWSGGREIRCLGHQPGDPATLIAAAAGVKGALHSLGIVTVTNRTFPGTVAYKRQAWASLCNVSGTPGPVEELTLEAGHAVQFEIFPGAVVDRGAVTPVAAQKQQTGGLGADTLVVPHICVEVFIFDCRFDGTAVNCLDGLEARADAPPPPP